MTDAELLELNELCNALADDRLDEPGRVRLNEALAASAPAREFYVRFAGLNASLCDYAGEAQCDTPAPPKPKIVRHPLAWWAGLGAAAAAAAVVALLAIREQPGDDAAPSVAWLTGARDARWSDAGGPQPGDPLERGQHLELRSGLAEVTFDSGASVVLEGPASIELESAWAASLKSGALTASAPSEAAGFRVANRAVAVTSLGGDVRIEADRHGSAEVVALSGTAEIAAPHRAERHLLKSKQARRFAGDRAIPVADLDAKLSRFAERARLDRQGRPVKLTRGSNARTVAFWVRVAKDAAPGQQPEIAGYRGNRSHRLRVAWNAMPEHGPLGALRTELGSESIVGRTSLRDGEWHHVAVMIVGPKKSGRIELKQYLDGKLEGATMLGSHKAGSDGTREVVQLTEPFVGGEHDKLIFADRPLTPFELRTLMETDTLPGGV